MWRPIPPYVRPPAAPKLLADYYVAPFQADPPSGIIWQTITIIEKKILQFQFDESRSVASAHDILTQIADFSRQYFNKSEKFRITLDQIMLTFTPCLERQPRAFLFSPPSPPADLFEPLLVLFHFLKTCLAVPSWWDSDRAVQLKKFAGRPIQINAEVLNDIVQIFLSQDNVTLSSCLRDWWHGDWATIGSQKVCDYLTENKYDQFSATPHNDGMQNTDPQIRAQVNTMLDIFDILCKRGGFLDLGEVDFIYAHTTQSGLLGKIMSAFSGSLSEFFCKNEADLILNQNNTIINISRDPIQGNMLLEMTADICWRSLQENVAPIRLAVIKVTLNVSGPYERINTQSTVYFIPTTTKLLIQYKFDDVDYSSSPRPGMNPKIQTLFINMPRTIKELWPEGRFGCAEIKMNRALV